MRIGSMRLGIAAVVGMLWLSATLEGAEPKDSRPFGMEKRVPWTTSNFRGRPEPPPPYKAGRLYSKLRFKGTTLLEVVPGSGQLLVGEQGGKIYALPPDRDAKKATEFLDCGQLVEQMNRKLKQPVTLEALYGMAFDPDFARNRYCYVCYVVRSAAANAEQYPDGTRVTRLKVSETEPLKCDVASEELIISWLQGGHNGGCLRFGLDGYLYISSGDGGFAFPPDGRKSGQDMTHLLSKILRIDVRRGENGKPYSIPADNPFRNLPNTRPETWAYGVRNPWKMSIDRKTGDLWVGDVGWELWELVYHVKKGDNYGWSIVEGSQQVHPEWPPGPTPIVKPAMEVPHTDGASITGGFVYRGKQFPELVGTYVFGDWETRRIWGAKIQADGSLADKVELIAPIVRIVDFAESADGELYLLDHDDGSIFTLSRNEVPANGAKFPRRLSDSGLFQSVAKHAVADGVLPFSVNVEQWNDGATAERFIAVPESGTIRVRPAPKAVEGSMFTRAVDYPLDTVLVKTLSLELVKGDPASRRRIETQVLHFDGREWQGYTYEWNADQTDATLVDRAGKNQKFQIVDPQAPGGHTTFDWRFSSRMECIRCHNPWSEYALAFSLPQLNRDHDFGGGRIDNQIRTYRHIGLLEEAPTERDPDAPPGWPSPAGALEKVPRLTPPFDEKSNLNLRARSYLHVNCGHCHRFNGGGAARFFVQHDLPLKEVKAIGVRPTQGTFGMADAHILTAGDPHKSILYYRLAKTGSGHMPHLGARQVDEQGLKLMQDWIRQLPVRFDDTVKLDRLIEIDEPTVLAAERKERPKAEWQAARRVAQKSQREVPDKLDLAEGKKQVAEEAAKLAQQRKEERTKLVEELLATPPKAGMLADAVRAQRIPPATTTLVLAKAVSAGTDPAIRDLFESFVPEEQRTRRLGDSINVAEILKMPGSVDRGRLLFHESTVVQCRNCHQIGGKGTELGPRLDSIGRKFDRAKILENILQPSQQIDPQYRTWVVETKGGKVLTGLLVKRDAKEVLLRDSQNKLTLVAAGEIEEIFSQNKSLMPELLVRDFTAQQLADLLQYLGTLRAEEPEGTKVRRSD